MVYTFTFDDYSPAELATILLTMAEQRGFAIAAGARPRLEVLIERGTSKVAKSIMNGGDCGQLFKFSEEILDRCCSAIGSASVEITEANIVEAMARIPSLEGD